MSIEQTPLVWNRRDAPHRRTGDSSGEAFVMAVPTSVAQMLNDWRSGDPQALKHLTPLVYDEMRRLARRYMRGERASHTLQATAVVHEAFLRIIQADVELKDQAHFFALASRLMRNVLVDHARSHARIKRIAIEKGLPAEDIAVEALNDALEGLIQLEPRLAEIVEMHYFGGLTYEQIAFATHTSPATVDRNLRLARAWLMTEINANQQK